MTDANPPQTIAGSATEDGDADLRAEIAAVEDRGGERRGRNHVLLIGVDGYAGRPLFGCVNDVLAIAEVLRERFDVRDDEITLLASPHVGREVPDTAPATAENIRDALERLASAAVAPEDRVVVQFSGHGGTQFVEGGRKRHAIECVLPIDFRDQGAKIYDVELNRRLAAIARRTRNLTVILDCCHSGGAARGPTVRSCPLPPIAAEDLPDAQELQAGRGIGRDVGPAPLVLAACLADQEAEEIERADGSPMGKLTHALTKVLRGLEPEARESCSWRELWPEIDAAVDGRQQPWLIGNGERLIFGLGLAREPGDLRVTPGDDGYQVHAGTLLDITPDTEIGVYGPEPATLPRLDSRADDAARLGTLRVDTASVSQAVARAVAPFAWPERARCRVVRYGKPSLQVRLEGREERVAELRAALQPLADMIDEDPKAVVRVVEDAAAGQWVLCDEKFGLASEGKYELARFETGAAASVLAHCQRYRAPLRLAERCTDLSGALDVRLLDAEVAPEDPQQPDLRQLPVTDRVNYRIALGTRFCIEVANDSGTPLQVVLLNVARDGQVEWLDSATVPRHAVHVFWRLGELGVPFCSSGEPGFDRFVAIGTTRPEITALESLCLNHGFAHVIDEAGKGRNAASDHETHRPERWTATRVTVEGILGPRAARSPGRQHAVARER